jgi:hypothetical protein
LHARNAHLSFCGRGADEPQSCQERDAGKISSNDEHGVILLFEKSGTRARPILPGFT